MDKKIMILSLLAACMLLMLPVVSAVECNTVTETKLLNFPKRIQYLDVEELNARLKDLGIDKLGEKSNFGLIKLLEKILQTLMGWTNWMIDHCLLLGPIVWPIYIISMLIYALGIALGLFEPPF